MNACRLWSTDFAPLLATKQPTTTWNDDNNNNNDDEFDGNVLSFADDFSINYFLSQNNYSFVLFLANFILFICKQSALSRGWTSK